MTLARLQCIRSTIVDWMKQYKGKTHVSDTICIGSATMQACQGRFHTQCEEKLDWKRANGNWSISQDWPEHRSTGSAHLKTKDRKPLTEHMQRLAPSWAWCMRRTCNQNSASQGPLGCNTNIAALMCCISLKRQLKHIKTSHIASPKTSHCTPLRKQETDQAIPKAL